MAHPKVSLIKYLISPACLRLAPFFPPPLSLSSSARKFSLKQAAWQESSRMFSRDLQVVIVALAWKSYRLSFLIMYTITILFLFQVYVKYNKGKTSLVGQPRSSIGNGSKWSDNSSVQTSKQYRNCAATECRYIYIVLHESRRRWLSSRESYATTRMSFSKGDIFPSVWILKKLNFKESLARELNRNWILRSRDSTAAVEDNVMDNTRCTWWWKINLGRVFNFTNSHGCGANNEMAWFHRIAK